MWSIGCVVYELFTGRILFPGRTNNEMLKLMMDVKGPFPKKMVKVGVCGGWCGSFSFSCRINYQCVHSLCCASPPAPNPRLSDRPTPACLLLFPPQRAEFAFKHFEGDANMSFALLEEDPVSKRPVRRLIGNPTVKKDFSALLAGQSPDRRKLSQLVDLLDRMMQLDPDKRISPKEALRHPFLKDAPPGAPGAAGA